MLLIDPSYMAAALVMSPRHRKRQIFQLLVMANRTHTWWYNRGPLIVLSPPSPAGFVEQILDILSISMAAYLVCVLCLCSVPCDRMVVRYHHQRTTRVLCLTLMTSLLLMRVWNAPDYGRGL